MLVAAHAQLLPRVHGDDVVAVEPGVDLAHAAHVDDRRAVHAREVARVQARGEDGYNGRYGPSWLHRWAMAEKKSKDFYAGEPEVPGWVLQLAGVASE